MQKRFIAYFLGLILATVAFVGNAQAEEFNLDPAESPKPCDQVAGVDVTWNYPPTILGCRLECGCELRAHVWHGTDASGQLHISVSWVATKSYQDPGCTNHLAKHHETGKVYNIKEKLGNLASYAELIWLEMKAYFDNLDISKTIVSSTASCQEYWSYDYTKEKYPDGLRLSGVYLDYGKMGEYGAHSYSKEASSQAYFTPYEIIKDEILTNWAMEIPCVATACCVSHLDIDYNNIDYYPGKIVQAFKSSVIAEQLSGDCKESSCKFFCDNLSYEYMPFNPRWKSLLDDKSIANLDVKIAPNPSDGNFSITFNNGHSKNLSYTILNLQGEELLNDDLKQGVNEISNTSSLSSGTYFITIKEEGKVIYTDKFIILK